MTTRLNLEPIRHGAVVKAMQGLAAAIEESTLEAPLRGLVKVRASQMNGCAYCMDMHTKDARAAGETEQRLYLLSGWRETPFYTERERAALAWTEAVTLIGDHGVPDELYEHARSVFTDDEIVALTLAVVEINGWNRLVRTAQPLVGTYKPARVAHAAHAAHA